MAKTKKMSVVTSAKEDLAITKEDLFTVLIAEQEENIYKEIETLKKDPLYKGIIPTDWYPDEEEIDLIGEEIKRQLSINDKDVKVRTTIMFDSNMKDEMKFYDINRLSGLKNPIRAANKTNTYYPLDRVSSTSIRVTLDKEIDENGFSGIIYKNIPDFTINKKLQKVIDDILSNKLKSLKLAQKVNHLEYEALTLDTDKQLKAKLIKKIVNTSNFKNLIK